MSYLTVSKILEPWVDCVLHKECIAPEGAELTCNKTNGLNAKVVYSGCHRYDQSAHNMILVREFGLSVWDSFHIKETAGIWKVQRNPTAFYTVGITKIITYLCGPINFGTVSTPACHVSFLLHCETSRIAS